MRVGLLAGVMLAAAGLSASWAQVPPSTITDPIRDQPRQTEQIQDLTGQSNLLRITQSGREVTYEDVLTHPDDVELNFEYAQTQIARGDLRSAGATLERILLTHPDLPRVRLLYAIVLYRLDNIDEAERELNAVRTLEMPPSLRAELDRYLEQVRLRRKVTRFTLTTSVNFQYDWNRNSAPAHNRRLVTDLQADVDGHDRRKQDQAVNGVARLEMSHDLGYQARHKITAGVTYFRGEQVHLGELDLQAAAGEIGGVYDANPVTIVPSLFARRIELANKFYGSSKGASLRGEYQWTADTQFFVLGSDELQEYKSIAESRTAQDSEGQLYTGGAGVSYTIDPTMRVTLELDGVRKNARRNYNSYDGAQLSLSHSWVFGPGLFLLSSLSGDKNVYDEADPLVSTMRRREYVGRARVTLGVPGSALFEGEDTPAFIRDLTLSLSVEALRSVSNLPNYTYNNRRASIGLSRRWEF